MVHCGCPMGDVSPDGGEGVLAVNLADGEYLARGSMPAFGRELGRVMFGRLSCFGRSILRGII